MVKQHQVEIVNGLTYTPVESMKPDGYWKTAWSSVPHVTDGGMTTHQNQALGLPKHSLKDTDY